MGIFFFTSRLCFRIQGVSARGRSPAHDADHIRMLTRCRMEEPATPVVKLRGESVDNTPADPEALPALSRPTTAIRKLDSLRRDKISYDSECA